MRYLNLFEDAIRRHEARAAHWRAQGNEEYAKGSDRKAAKWRARRDDLNAIFRTHDPLLDAMLQDRQEQLAEQLAEEFNNVLIKGDSSV